MPIIEVDHVTKEFQLGQFHSIKQTALNSIKRLSGKPVENHPPFKALDDVSFSVQEGEVLGIIGHNGAGKSTLLKLLANISQPTRGSVRVKGRVAPLIEVGAGLVGDLTGRENIYLNGTLLGMSRREIKRKFDEIVDFADIEEFIDTPIKRYSSGMQVRLGFSIATCVQSEILIIDEVLAVGDLAFQRKCFDRMENLISRQGKTVLLVSHNIRQIERVCTRVLSMKNGKVVGDGAPNMVCNAFVTDMNAVIRSQNTLSQTREIHNSGEICNIDVRLLDSASNVTTTIEFKKPATIQTSFTVTVPIKDAAFYIGFHTTDFVYLTNNNTAYQTVDLSPGDHTVELTFPQITLIPGVYSILLWIGTPAGKVTYHAENILALSVSSDDYAISRQHSQALFYIPGTWSHLHKESKSELATTTP